MEVKRRERRSCLTDVCREVQRLEMIHVVTTTILVWRSLVQLGARHSHRRGIIYFVAILRHFALYHFSFPPRTYVPFYRSFPSHYPSLSPPILRSILTYLYRSFSSICPPVPLRRFPYPLLLSLGTSYPPNIDYPLRSRGTVSPSSFLRLPLSLSRPSLDRLDSPLFPSRSHSVLALLPGFLVSGKIQGSVKTAKDFAKQQDELIKELVAVDAWGKGEDKGAGCVFELSRFSGDVQCS